MATTTASRGSRSRASLDRGLILETALAIAADGRPLTVRALGTALGADPTAVYRHFRDKDELVRGIWDHLLQSLLGELDDSLPWREQLRAIASTSLDVCLRYPAIGQEAHAITTRGPGELDTVELLLEQFMRAGLDAPAAVRYYAVFSSYVLTMAGSIAGAAASAGPAAAEDQVWIGDVGPVDPRRYPVVFAVRDELASLRDSEIFMKGVDVILDAAQSEVEHGRAADPGT